MKTTAFLLVFAFLILDVRGKKKVDPDYFFKMSAAQVSCIKSLLSAFKAILS